MSGTDDPRPARRSGVLGPAALRGRPDARSRWRPWPTSRGSARSTWRASTGSRSIDLVENPKLARSDQILAIPTLVRRLPEPMRKIIGDLSNSERCWWGWKSAPAELIRRQAVTQDHANDDLPMKEIDEHRAHLQEAEETLRAIRQGEVDALVVTERPRRTGLHPKEPGPPVPPDDRGMRQGAVTLTADGTGALLQRQLRRDAEDAASEHHRLRAATPRRAVQPRLPRGSPAAGGGGQGEILLQAAGGTAAGLRRIQRAAAGGPGEPVLCMVVTDLTEQKRSERLERAWTTAEAMNQAKDRFLATLSHELRTPLTPCSP